MATKKYLDQQGLERLWGYISAADTAEATLREQADTALDGRLDTIEATLGASGTIGSDVADLKTRMTGAEGDIDNLETRMGTAEGDIDNLETALGATSNPDEGTVRARLNAAESDISTLEGQVGTLIGSDTNKSVRTIANEELAAQLIPANAQESLDTLGEIAAWIQAHPGDASAMNAAITALQTKTTLGTYVPEGEEEAVQYATVKAYVEAMIDEVNGDAAALAGRVEDLEDGLGTASDSAAAAGTTAWSRIKQAESDIDDLQADVGADGTESDSTVWGRLNTAESDINTIETGIGADGESSASTVWGRLNTAEGKITTLEGLHADGTNGKKTVAQEVAAGIADLDGSVSASGTAANNGVFVLTSVTEVDGIITSGTSTEVDPAGSAATAKSQVIGTDQDAASADTVYGAKAYADAATAALSNSEIDAACGKTEQSGT